MSTGSAALWNRTPTSLAFHQTIAEANCQSGDTSYVSTSTGTARFWVGLAPGSENNGKAIRQVDIAVCYRGGASAGAAFSPFVRLDGTNYDGAGLTANTTAGCTETIQSIEFPSPVHKSDATVIEVGAVKSEGDTKTVRICSMRATIHYESDDPPPPPPLPTVAKAAATPSLDADLAYWGVTIDNSAADAVARDGLVITDGFADAVLESVTPAGSCGSLGTTSPWTCDVAAGGTTVLRVSRPRSALADACTGGSLSNSLASAVLGDGTALQISSGGEASPVGVTIPPDFSACPLPTVRLVAHDPPLASGHASWDIVIDQPAEHAIARSVTLTPAHAVEIEGQEPAGSCVPLGEAFTCDLPAGQDIVLSVRRAVTEENLDTGNLCSGGTIAEHLAGAALGDSTPLTISEGSTASPVAYVVQDTSTCDPVALTKALLPEHEPLVIEPGAVAWKLTMANPPGGRGEATGWIRDQGMSVIDGPVYSSGEGYCTGDLVSAGGAACALPAGVSVSWTVGSSAIIERTCDSQTFENTAHYRLDPDGEWIELPGPAIQLTGDSSLCTRTLQVCLIVEDNADGVAAPDGGGFRFGNGGNSETLMLHAVEGGSECGEMVAPATPVSVFQFAADTGDRPGSNGLSGSWSGDADGFPRASTGVSTCDSAPQTGTVALTETMSAVTFCNRPLARTKTVTVVRHYFPPTAPVVRPVLTFSNPTILPGCTGVDGLDGATTTWSCLVPADWSGTVQTGEQDGWVEGACADGLGDEVEPGAYSRTCAYQLGAVTVTVDYQGHGVPVAATDTPLVAVDGLSVAPNPANSPVPTSWGPLPGSPLLHREVALVTDLTRWQFTGIPGLSGEGCVWASEPLPGTSTAAVDVPPGGDCVVTFSLERLVASVVVHQIYLNGPGDPPNLTVAVDGHPDATTWEATGSPSDRWEKPVGVAGSGSTLEVAATLAPGWAPVAVVEGACTVHDGPVTPLPGSTATVTIPGVGPGDTVEVCFVSVAVGGVVLVTNETHATDGPEAWGFATTSPALGNPSLVTAPNPATPAVPRTAQQAFALVPAGDYAISQTGGRTACLPGATALAFETRAAAKAGLPPSDAESSNVAGPAPIPFTVAKGETTYIRFDNVGCGTVLETGLIAVEVVNDLDGDGVRDPDEEGVASWPVAISGPDGDADLVTGSQGMAHYTVVTGGTHLLRQGSLPGWLATATEEVSVTAGLGETRSVSFFNQPRVSVAASITEISLASPGGAPGEGWTFVLAGCGLTRSLETPASGIVTFDDLPPAIACAYTASVSSRVGWATIEPSKSANPALAGQVAPLTFVAVKVDVCLDCVPAAAVTGSQPSPAVPAVIVLPGANLVAWPGGRVPVDEAFGLAAAVKAVYFWDESLGEWRKYFPGLPGYLSDLQMLEPGAAYWVIASTRATLLLPGPD